MSRHWSGSEENTEALSLRIVPALRDELREAAMSEKRNLANFAEILLVWSFEQYKKTGLSSLELTKLDVLPQWKSEEHSR